MGFLVLEFWSSEVGGFMGYFCSLLEVLFGDIDKGLGDVVLVWFCLFWVVSEGFSRGG